MTTIDYFYSGGITGYLYLSSISESGSYVNLDSCNTIWSGGITGYVNDSSIINSYATGNVCGDARIGSWNYRGIGGLAGYVYSGVVKNSYASGKIVTYSGGTYLGGLTGYVGGTFTSSYWDTQTSQQSSSGGGIGKTTVEMKQQSMFSDWDFENVWCMPEGDYPRLKFEDACSLPNCTGCAVLSDGVCVAGDSCSGEHPNCVVTDNNGICECSSLSCNAGRSCSEIGMCEDCDAANICGACSCGTSQKPTGTGTCINDSSCCIGECNMATGANSCGYSDDLCSAGIACNRATLSCCDNELPYWRSDDCKSCTATSGLSGFCQRKGMMCNSNYNCVNCFANMQCTCDDGYISDGAGNCVEPFCYADGECGDDRCVNAGDYNAFCTDCSVTSKVWVNGICESCPSGSVYHSGVCLCSDGKLWNSASNICSKKSLISSHGVIETRSKSSTETPESRYDRIKRKMNRITNSAYAGFADKEVEESFAN
ncbi:MAG: GLUG motif-containing protein [Alphaproteobacteria bacterium]